MKENSSQYHAKKMQFANMLCIYGRKAVLEALQSDLDIFRIHVANSNKPAAILKDIHKRAQQKNIEIVTHDKQALSRISKNSKQDQGIAADIRCPKHQGFDDWFRNHKNKPFRLLALENIHNPQNVGMIIRSATAAGVDGILIAKKGNAALGPLVVKASAGSIFKAPIVHCEQLAPALKQLAENKSDIVILDAKASTTLHSFTQTEQSCFVLGNETDGISAQSRDISTQALAIPMSNEIESLNVAVTAALISYLPHYK